MIAQQVKEIIETQLENAEAHIRDFTGTGDHLEVNVIWPGFEGMPRVRQQQKVYALLNHLIGDGKPIHALSMKTWAVAPEELSRPADSYYGV
jgi:acid stress-induced BolA-like protein IbaG/YrbA